MSQSKEVHREYMRKRREGSQKGKGSQEKVVESCEPVSTEGAFEAQPIPQPGEEGRMEYIKGYLNDPYRVALIGMWGRYKDDTEGRLERAYRYKVWVEGGKPMGDISLPLVAEGVV